MIVDKDNPPPLDKCMGSVHFFERGLDPWHSDAFPDKFKFVGKTGERKEGWFAIDGYGNAIGFIPDGAEVK